MKYSQRNMTDANDFIRQSRLSKLDKELDTQAKPIGIREKIKIFFKKIYRCVCCCIIINKRKTKTTETERFIPKQKRQPLLTMKEINLIRYVRHKGNMKINPTLQLANYVLKNDSKRVRTTINTIEDNKVMSANKLIAAIDAQNSKDQREIALQILNHEQRRIRCIKKHRA